MKKVHYSRRRKRPRWSLIVLIVLLHIAALYGLARAFAPVFTKGIEEEIVSGLTVIVTTADIEPPPETEPEPDEGAQGDPGKEAVPQEVTAPEPRVKRPEPKPKPRASSTGTASQSGAREDGDGTGAEGSGDGTGSGNSGSGQGNDRTVPPTRPSVRSGQINTARDFPIPEGGRSSRFGKSVTVAFTVTTDGRAKNCSVSRTQADAETTALVCGLVIEKIRFNPATNQFGKPVEARYGYRVDFRGR